MLRNAYGKRTVFIGDIAHKTEQLLRKNATTEGLDRLSNTVEFDADALKALSDRGASEREGHQPSGYARGRAGHVKEKKTQV